MKIPFVKGYVIIDLDKDKIPDFTSTIDKMAALNLLFNCLYYKFNFDSDLFEASSVIIPYFSGPSFLSYIFLLIMID